MSKRIAAVLAGVAVAVAATLAVRAGLPAPKEAKPASAAASDFFGFIKPAAPAEPGPAVWTRARDTLVVDSTLRRLFDDALAQGGSMQLPTIRLGLEAELERRLSGEAAAIAKNLLGRYLDYKNALIGIEHRQTTGEQTETTMADRVAALLDLRARYFSAQESAGLFGADDAYERALAERMEIRQNRQLSESQKQERVAAHDANLPAALREMRSASLELARVEQLVQAMRAEGASEDAVYRLRAGALPADVVANLSAMEQGEAAWKTRIEAYRTQRDALLNGGASNEAALASSLQRLREAHFRPEEMGQFQAYAEPGVPQLSQ